MTWYVLQKRQIDSSENSSSMPSSKAAKPQETLVFKTNYFSCIILELFQCKQEDILFPDGLRATKSVVVDLS